MKLFYKRLDLSELKYSASKSAAAFQATKVRIEKVKYKMNIAIEILQTQKKEITHYAIAKISNVSFNTVAKIGLNRTPMSE